MLAGEVDWGIQVEGAVALEDVLYRRTGVALYEPELRETLVEPTAHRMAELLAWDPERTQTEIESMRTRLDHDLAFRDLG